MMNLKVAALLAGLCGAGLIAAAPPTTSPSMGMGEPTTQPVDPKPINKMCAVNPNDEVDPDVTTVYKGQTVGFCCKDCVKKFKKDPDKYMSKLK